MLFYVYLNWFWCNSLLKCILQFEIVKKFIKIPFWPSRSSKVIEFGSNREPAYDFLLVINSNLSLPHTVIEITVTYSPKIEYFSYLFLI